MLQAFLKDDSGTATIEYGLIAGLVSIAILAAVVSLGDTVEMAYTSVNDDIAVAIGTPPPVDAPADVMVVEAIAIR